jgi:hypothetical protein
MHAVMSARPNMSALLTVLTLASHQMLGRARDLSVGSDSDRQLAVIFAHSACELHTEQIMKELVRHRAPALADVIFKLLGLGVHLENSRVRKVYSALTGDDPAPKEKQAEWW